MPNGHESVVLWHAPPLTEIDTIERSRAGTTSTVANEESKRNPVARRRVIVAVPIVGGDPVKGPKNRGGVAL